MQKTINQITEAPELIKQSELNILEIKNSITSIKEKMNSICRTTACEVAAEISEGGKKTFSNAEMREAEVEKRLQHDETYQILKQKLLEEETRKSQEEIGLQYVRDEYSANRYKVRLQCAAKLEKASDSFFGGMQILAGLDRLLTQFNGVNLASDSGRELPPDCPF